jgi:3-deoxy-manno-octulosonate cytidylyltransferase (CMP-KDO synthetase)
MNATRLPGKPLLMIGAEPMIVHVWRRAKEAGIGPVSRRLPMPSSKPGAGRF